MSNVLCRIDRLQQQQVDKTYHYWRNILKRCISVIRLLAERVLAFTGKNEIVTSPSSGNYLGVLELLAVYDTFLAEHIHLHAKRGSDHTNYLSSTVCEELMKVIGKVILKIMVERIKKSKYYSVSVDSTPDISHVDQLTIVVRYIKDTEWISWAVHNISWQQRSHGKGTSWFTIACVSNELHKCWWLPWSIIITRPTCQASTMVVYDFHFDAAMWFFLNFHYYDPFSCSKLRFFSLAGDWPAVGHVPEGENIIIRAGWRLVVVELSTVCRDQFNPLRRFFSVNILRKSVSYSVSWITNVRSTRPFWAADVVSARYQPSLGSIRADRGQGRWGADDV